MSRRDVSRYYVARGETLPLNPDTRRWLRGSYISLTDGMTHYELTGPEDGELVFPLGSLTVPLFYWDAVTAGLHRRGLRTLTYSTYGPATPTGSAVLTTGRGCSSPSGIGSSPTAATWCPSNIPT